MVLIETNLIIFPTVLPVQVQVEVWALLLFIGRFYGLRFNGHFRHFVKCVLILMLESAKVDNHCMWVIAYNEAAFAVPAGSVGGGVVVGGCLRQQ